MTVFGTAQLRMVALGLLALATTVDSAWAQQQQPQRGGQRQEQGPNRMIETLDGDRNGRVSLAEMLAEHTRLFGTADIDKDGALSVDEFRQRGSLLMRSGSLTLFDLLDTNGDQHITAEEIGAVTARWLRRYDKDGDGAIEAEELPQVQQAQPRRQQQRQPQQQPAR